jgi:hypothetical protein
MLQPGTGVDDSFGGIAPAYDTMAGMEGLTRKQQHQVMLSQHMRMQQQQFLQSQQQWQHQMQMGSMMGQAFGGNPNMGPFGGNPPNMG